MNREDRSIFFQYFLNYYINIFFSQVQRALQTSSFNFNGQELTSEIVVRVKPFIEKALKEEIQKVQQINPDELVDRIIIRLKPIVIKVIQTTVRAENVDLSNTRGLIQTIITGLRPITLQEVQAAIQATGATYLNAQELADKIVDRLMPFVQEGVKKEVQVVQQQSNSGLVSDIIKQLTPHIVDSVDDALGGPKLQPATAQKAGASFLGNLRPLIKRAVIKVMRENPGLRDQEKIINLVLQEFQDGSLLNLITDEVRAALGPGAQLPAQEEIIALLNSLRGDIRRIVIEEIGFFNNANNVSDADRRRVIEAILRLLRDQVVRATNQYLQGKNPAQVTDRQVVEAVSGSLRGQIVSIIQSELPNLDLNSDAFSNLMSGAMSQMRPIILETVQAWRQRLAAEAAAAAAAAAKPEPPKTDAVTSIFGSGGANNIKVKTQDFQFNTAWE